MLDKLVSGELTMRLNSPLTEEQWDMIADTEFDHTKNIWFTTKHGKMVEFVKVVRCGECKHWKRIRNDCILASCELYALVRSEDFFCADGERMDGDGE